MTWRDELAKLTAAGIAPRYPWEQWFDGEAHHLEHGLDYHGTTLRLQHAAKHAAKRLGVRVRTRTTETGCMLVALQGGEEATRRTVNPLNAGSNPAPAAEEVA